MSKIHPSVKLGKGVIIEGDVAIASGCEIGAYSIIQGPCVIGPDNTFYQHTVIGGDPQDKKYKGGGKLTIGRSNIFREFVTVHRGHLTKEGTVIGDDNWFLSSAHVGHDCKIKDRNFIANNVLLAGHVEMGSDINMSGNAGSHQFCKIGDHAMISGLSGIRSDIYPYAMVQGDPAVHLGMNSVGLKRAGWSEKEIFEVKEAFRFLRSGECNPEKTNKIYNEMLEIRKKSARGMAKFKRFKR